MPSLTVRLWGLGSWFALIISLATTTVVLAATEEACETAVHPNQDWFPIDDPTADLAPVRALNVPWSQCQSAPRPAMIESEVALLDFFDRSKNNQYSPSDGVVFVALNGASRGALFKVEQMNCLGTLARVAYDALAPSNWEKDGPLFLYSSGGLPIRSAADVDTRARRELYVLSARQVWVWPAHRIHLKYQIGDTTMVTVSDRPRAFSLENFVPLAMCDEIIKEYDGKLEPSPEKHYSDQFKNHRTSETGWMSDHPLRRKMQRILRLPDLDNVENLQFLKYVEGKWYKYHHDYFHNYKPSPWQEIRQWIRMRIASLTELPEDWSPETEDERTAERVLKQSAEVFKSVLSNPRGRVTLTNKRKSTQVPVLLYVMDLSTRRPGPILKRVIPEIFKSLGIQDNDWQHVTFDAHAKNEYDRLVASASKILARHIAQELSSLLPSHSLTMDDFISALEYPDRFAHVEVLETMSITSQIQPNRHATILPYLSDVELGGETALPHAKNPKAFLGQGFVYPKYQGAPECSKGLLLKPKKGSASLFYHRLPGGELDDLSLHAGCPPQKGTKYAINGFTWSTSSEFGIAHFLD